MTRLCVRIDYFVSRLEVKGAAGQILNADYRENNS